jgi:hypothetical protein
MATAESTATAEETGTLWAAATPPGTQQQQGCYQQYGHQASVTAPSQATLPYGLSNSIFLKVLY